MADQLSNYKCQACMGPLRFVGESGRLECEHCGSSYTVSQIESLMDEDYQKAKEADLAESSKEEWTPEGMKSYNCPQCGAQLITDETTAATACPYCGNQAVVSGAFAGDLEPDYILPFKLGQDVAKDRLRNHYKHRPLLPRNFSNENHIDKIQGVYVPFWLYNGKVAGSASFDATKEFRTETATETVITTDHYMVMRGGDATFVGVPVDASSKMPDAYMDSIEPYDYSQMKDFSKAYLAGYLADRYDVSPIAARDKAKGRVTKTFLAMLAQTVVGYSSFINTSANTNLSFGKVGYAMLPVYMLSTNWNGKNYLFAMNGQTGKMVGDLPIDAGKLIRNVLITIIICLLAAFGIVYLVNHEFTMVPSAVAGISSLIMGLIVGLVQWRMMKTVHIASKAWDYMPRDKFRLTLTTDTFVRQQVSRVSKQTYSGNNHY